MPASLRDRCVVIVGGSSGIGLATAKMAREAGARIVIAGRDEDRLATACREIGGDTRGVACDVADEAAVKDFFASIDEVDHVATLAARTSPARLPMSTPRSSRARSATGSGGRSTSASTPHRR